MLSKILLDMKMKRFLLNMKNSKKIIESDSRTDFEFDDRYIVLTPFYKCRLRIVKYPNEIYDNDKQATIQLSKIHKLFLFALKVLKPDLHMHNKLIIFIIHFLEKLNKFYEWKAVDYYTIDMLYETKYVTFEIFDQETWMPVKS